MSDKDGKKIVFLDGRYYEEECKKLEIDLSKFLGKKIASILPISGEAICACIMNFEDGSSVVLYLETGKKEEMHKRLVEQFHNLWTKAVGAKDYVKREWTDLIDYLSEFQVKI